MQLSHEWGKPICAIKLDLEKAFDCLGRIGLATLLVDKLGETHPTEVKNLLTMLREGTACVPTIWGEGNTRMHIGVRQGGVESATLFSWVISIVVEELGKQWPDGGWLSDSPTEEQAYMDDLIMWDGQISGLQSSVCALQSILDRFGLKINPIKSSLLCSGNVGGDFVMLEGRRIEALQPTDGPWEVMGLPVFPGVKESEVVAALIAKARNKFFVAQDVLCSQPPIQQRLRLLDRIIWPAMAWCIGSIFSTKSAIALINEFHVQCVGVMAKFHRRPEELHYAYRMRSIRGSRQLIHASGRDRWGTRFVRCYWSYAGHRARSLFQTFPTSAGILTGFRGYLWWKNQQQSVVGSRRNRHRFPKISNEARDLTQIACEGDMTGDWTIVAPNRQRWKQLEAKWTAAHDISWCSGRQLALPLRPSSAQSQPHSQSQLAIM